MTPADGVLFVVTVFVALPVIYLALSYWIWRGNDQLRRDIRQVERNLQKARGGS